MQINCPHCHHFGTIHPEALLGRLYVCAHCHLMLRLACHVPHAHQWLPFPTPGGSQRQETNDRGEGNV